MKEAWIFLKGNPSMATYENEETIHPAAMNYARLPDNEVHYEDRHYGRDTPPEIADVLDATTRGTEYTDAVDKLTPEQKKDMDLNRYRRAAKDATSRQMNAVMGDEGEREDAHQTRHVQRMPRPEDERPTYTNLSQPSNKGPTRRDMRGENPFERRKK